MSIELRRVQSQHDNWRLLHNVRWGLSLPRRNRPLQWFVYTDFAEFIDSLIKAQLE